MVKQSSTQNQSREVALDLRSGVLSRSVDDRIDAIRACRERLEDAARLLSGRLAAERNEIVLVEILETLAELTLDSATLAAVTRLAIGHGSPLVRAYAVRALSYQIDSRVIEFLMTRVASEKHAQVRLELFVALYRFGFKAFFDHLTALMLSADYRTQCAAINNLVELDLGADREAFAKALLELKGRKVPPAVRGTLERALSVLHDDGSN